MKKTFILFILFLMSAPGFAAGKLILKNAWIREAPPTAKNLAGYAEVRNIGDDVLTIASIASPMFEKVEMHVTTFDKGMMRMEQVESLKLFSGESIYFEPGGKHFMLIKPRQAIKAGLKVPLNVTLKSGKVVTFELDVRK